MFASFYNDSLIKSACQHLLLLVGFDTLIYRSTTIHPLYLWVIKTIFWHRCRGVKHYWKVELVKETCTISVVFIFGLLFYFVMEKSSFYSLFGNTYATTM